MAKADGQGWWPRHRGIGEDLEEELLVAEDGGTIEVLDLISVVREDTVRASLLALDECLKARDL